MKCSLKSVKKESAGAWPPQTQSKTGNTQWSLTPEAHNAINTIQTLNLKLPAKPAFRDPFKVAVEPEHGFHVVVYIDYSCVCFVASPFISIGQDRRRRGG